MQISLEKFSLFLTGVISLGLVAGTGYLLFTIFFNAPSPDPVPVLTYANVGVLGPKIQKAAAVLVDPQQKVELNKQKNLKFLESDLFKSFTVKPEDVLLSESRGREDPFVPYVAP
jgi:hypothetical protein